MALGSVNSTSFLGLTSATRQPLENNKGYVAPANWETNGYHQAAAPVDIIKGMEQILAAQEKGSINTASIGATSNPIDPVASTQGTGFVPTNDGECHPIYGEDEHIINFYG